jgi:hypothetical protein
LNFFKRIAYFFWRADKLRELDVEVSMLRIELNHGHDVLKKLQDENKKHILTIEQKEKEFKDATDTIAKLYAKTAIYEASHINFYEHVNENLREWEKVGNLVRLNVFRSLVRFVAKEYERVFVDDIRDPEQVHKFWHVQGAKSVLHQLLTYDAIIKDRMNKLAGVQAQTSEGKPADPDLSYE